MRKTPFLLLLVAFALPAFAAKSVTVEQLERVLAAARHRTDAKAAKQLSGLQLTERFSPAMLTRWEPALPGPESRRALVLLADVSAFLDPPSAEIPAKSPPDLATQRRIMALAVDYAAMTVRQLPNIFATRDTIHFEDSPARQHAQGVDGMFTAYQPMHPVSRSSATVLYLNGQEIVDPEVSSSRTSKPTSPGLTTRGEFGPILGTVLMDAAHGTLAWSHWEHGPARPVAVFHFSVSRDRSHYQVEFCCVAKQGKGGVFRAFSAYHGEIAVDPADGTILRLTLIANLRKADPVIESDIVVDYGPVAMGGKTYICPTKSISMSLAPGQPVEGVRMQNQQGALVQPSEEEVSPPLQRMLNEVQFEQYHLFRADVHVVMAGNGKAGGNMTAPGAAGGANVPTKGAAEEHEPAAESPAPLTTAENRRPVAPAAPVASVVAATVTVPPSTPAVPETSVAAATGLPEPSNKPLAPGEKSFTLHVTTRLVDVGIVALDKKGHLVTDLQAANFEIYDNGRSQVVQFFSRAAGTSAGESAQGQPEPAADPLVVSNRRSMMTDAKPGAAATDSLTILLIDANGLAWADFSHARAGMLKFLHALPAGERVGLYVESGPGFQILEEGTTDHALLASTLRQWMPSAQVLARAQETEQRNRQQFDYVANQSDLQYVNGNMNTAPDSATPVDPKLRRQGSDPGRDALSVLVAMARHLGALPGHKNVVWVASDNVLSDWTRQALKDETDSRDINDLALRAQEALNDAHASLYPLDASQLEAMAVDPGLANLNVELSPSTMAPPAPHGGGPGSGRAAAELQQDTRVIAPAIQEVARATGGRSFPRSGEIAKELKTVVADGQATYLLGFIPDMPADGKYHRLTVRLNARRGVRLRYRTGYLYAVGPSTLQDRFRQAIWQPFDVNDITVSARPAPSSMGKTLKLSIAANDLALSLQDERWTDKLDIFLVERDDEELHAQISGQTLSLRLKAATYQSLLRSGIPFDQFIEKKPDIGSIRIVVVDENSGRIGSITIPAGMFEGTS